MRLPTLFPLLLGCAFCFRSVAAPEPVFPGKTWQHDAPENLGLSAGKLAELRDLVGGRGCVVRHGKMAFAWGDQSKSQDIASAMKPVISTLLFVAIAEHRLKSSDDLVADFEPRLRSINHGKDAAIAWRHLASQTSGYGLVEKPGEAWAYNDFALALYYDTLTGKVFQQTGLEVFCTRLAEPLQFEDAFSFDKPKAGRLAVSVRDFARFGLLCLHRGKWNDRQLVDARAFDVMLNSPVPAALARTSGVEAEMIPGQRSLGGTRNITPTGPGFYSFNWWLNRTNALGRRLFTDAPPDTFVAAGHGGMRALWIMPSLDLVCSWNDSTIDDHDKSPGNPNSKMNRAARLLKEAALVGGTAE
ncbi:MAG: serine hydrolase [Verrucomicrobia bacterium]|nr:serine hydrolase [Verrucomicrobiota bacterium]